MKSFREQMTAFAQELVAETESRRQFVDQNRQDVQRLQQRHARELKNTSAQVRSETTAVVQNVRNRVSRTLDAHRSRRIRSGAEQRMARRQAISQIKRNVSSHLERSQSRRMRNAKHRSIATTQFSQRVRRRVSEIRKESARFTSRVAADLQAGREVLAAARRRISSVPQSSETPSTSSAV